MPIRTGEHRALRWLFGDSYKGPAQVSPLDFCDHVLASEELNHGGHGADQLSCRSSSTRHQANGQLTAVDPPSVSTVSPVVQGFGCGEKGVLGLFQPGMDRTHVCASFLRECVERGC